MGSDVLQDCRSVTTACLPGSPVGLDELFQSLSGNVYGNTTEKNENENNRNEKKDLRQELIVGGVHLDVNVCHFLSRFLLPFV